MILLGIGAVIAALGYAAPRVYNTVRAYRSPVDERA